MASITLARSCSPPVAAFGKGRIDIWINNAGVGAVGSIEQTPLDAHAQVLQTDLRGYLRGPVLTKSGSLQYGLPETGLSSNELWNRTVHALL
jgi:NAD(P)-dependent dehydrogenase (short-subunit alcohol dehydrogenase family)